MRDRHRSLLVAAVLGLVAVGPARATDDPACDDFERSALGGDWTRYGGSAADIVNDSDLGVPNTSWCFAGWTESLFTADQYSQATTSGDKPVTMLTQVYVRRRSSDLARYGFHYNGDPGEAQWEIKFDGVPTPQTRILASLPAPPPTPGDGICIEIEGTTIRGYHNGALVLSATDTASDRIVNPGVAGVVARNAQMTTNTPPTPIFESWTGGSLTPGRGCAAPAGGILLYATRSLRDVLLDWSGGSAPYSVDRAEQNPVDFEEIAACVSGPNWVDPLVVDDGRLLFYRIRP